MNARMTMNIKIVSSEKGNNKGSSAQAVFYLEKENEGKSLSEKEWFFTHDKDSVGIREAIDTLDGNKKQLGRNDAKFFMVVISPSQEELEHVGSDKEKLRAYTREVMDQYAQNFNRGLKGEDLVYFAKIEEHRHFKGDDAEVLAGKVKQGDQKPGAQTHIHVLVSRKCKDNKLKLSPLSKHRSTQKGPVKGGFTRTDFYEKAEEAFDKGFNYSRKIEQSFAYHNTLKNRGPKERVRMKMRAASQKQELAMSGGNAVVQALHKTQKALNKDQGAAHREIREKKEASKEDKHLDF